MEFKTNNGEKLSEILAEQKVLLVFLRHFGCTFCRETMSDLSKVKHELDRNGIDIVVVHMIDFETAQEMLDLYGLGNVQHVSDKSKILYKKYGLHRTSARAMFGFKNWWRAFVAGLMKGHLVGKPAGDPWQMPGVFFINNNQIINKFEYRYVSDRPDFRTLARA
jgi:thiol-disulfide isomerase/thioredoxin